MKRRSALLLAASALCLLRLLPTPASEAKQEKIKLTATVTALAPIHVPGFKPAKGQKASVVTLKQGPKKVGKLVAYAQGGAGKEYDFAGTIALTVGSVRGKHGILLNFKYTGNYCPACSPPSYGTVPKFGSATVDGETIIVHGSGISSKVGSKFGMTLVSK